MSIQFQDNHRKERITPGKGVNNGDIGLGPGITLREFASSRLGAVGFSTGLSTFAPGSYLNYHTYACGETLTILEGEAKVVVQGRSYHLRPFDCMYIPANVAHAVGSLTAGDGLLIHTAFNSAAPALGLVEDAFEFQDRRDSLPGAGDPESLCRFHLAEEYELSEKALFRDLSGSVLGSSGICGGYGRFAPGASLPCHIHDYDESITIVEGKATCLVEGRSYSLSDYGTALVPRGLRHRFINESDAPMAMIWVYAGDRPERTVVDNQFCRDGGGARV